MTSGYSHKTLVEKLGLKQNGRALLINAPSNYQNELKPLPEGVEFVSKDARDLDFIQLFVKTTTELAEYCLPLKASLKKDGMLWVSWPKGSSGVTTDLNDNNVRDFGLIAGLVDVKVVSVDEVWSGIKFVYRLKDR
jgi:hypothetical protein